MNRRNQSQVRRKEETVESYTSNGVVPTGYASTIVGLVLIALAVISGAVYVILQWFERAIVEDAVFVSMLIAATMILVSGLKVLRKYIINKGLDFYSFLFSTHDPEEGYRNYEKLYNTIFNVRSMTITGILYGALIGTSPFILHIWSEEVVLRISLVTFLFFVNFVTGVGFYGLITFFKFAIKMGSMVKVDLWQVDNPSTNFLLGATRRIAILASLYICISISSILFSLLPITGWVIAYSVFSGSIILAALTIPSYPVIRKLQDAKNKALIDIDHQIHSVFSETLQKMKAGSNNVDLSNFDSLLQLRENIDSINVWPFKIQYIASSLSVILFSSFPMMLQYFLERVYS